MFCAGLAAECLPGALGVTLMGVAVVRGQPVRWHRVWVSGQVLECAETWGVPNHDGDQEGSPAPDQLSYTIHAEHLVPSQIGMLSLTCLCGR